MVKKLIFVSCGQATDQEKTLGIAIKEVIDGTEGFEAYFAESVHDLDSLGRNIFEGLRRCSGGVAILHNRGKAFSRSGDYWGIRSSVWVNQELAILAYRQFFESTPVPVLAFIESEVKLEGAMTALIVNPLPLSAVSDVVKAVRSWLKDVAAHASGPASDEVFDEKWSRLSPNAKKVLACLIDEGGEQVKEASIRRALEHKYKMPSNDTTQAVREAGQEFINTDLVKLVHDLHSGDEMTLHPTWKWHLRRGITRWRAENE